MPRPHHASSHVNDTQKMTLDLGIRAIGAETCKLGANCHGAEVRIYFLKDTARGVFMKIFKKGAEKQKKYGCLLQSYNTLSELLMLSMAIHHKSIWYVVTTDEYTCFWSLLKSEDIIA